MRRQFALRAEFLARPHDDDAENLLPEAVGDDAGRERVFLTHQPLRELQAVRRGVRGERLGQGFADLGAGLAAAPLLDERAQVGAAEGRQPAGGGEPRAVVPVLEGANHDEYRMFVAANELQTGVAITAGTYVAALTAIFGNATLASQLASIYPVGNYATPGLATAPATCTWSTLHMLVMFGARERTAEEYDALLVAAGFPPASLAASPNTWNVLVSGPLPSVQ